MVASKKLVWNDNSDYTLCDVIGAVALGSTGKFKKGDFWEEVAKQMASNEMVINAEGARKHWSLLYGKHKELYDAHEAQTGIEDELTELTERVIEAAAVMNSAQMRARNGNPIPPEKLCKEKEEGQSVVNNALKRLDLGGVSGSGSNSTLSSSGADVEEPGAKRRKGGDSDLIEALKLLQDDEKGLERDLIVQKQRLEYEEAAEERREHRRMEFEKARAEETHRRTMEMFAASSSILEKLLKAVNKD